MTTPMSSNGSGSMGTDQALNALAQVCERYLAAHQALSGSIMNPSILADRQTLQQALTVLQAAIGAESPEPVET